MVKEGDLVAVFHSVHRVLKAEKILKEHQLPFRMIPAPRQIAADCGLALCFVPEDRSAIEDVLTAAEMGIVELWRFESGDYSRLK